MRQLIFSRISPLVIIIFLLSACGVSQSELDKANSKIAELEAKLELEKTKQVLVKEQEPDVGVSLTPERKETPSISQWEYHSSEDKMTGGTTYGAKVISTNTIEFSSPYTGEQHATLNIRDDPKYGNDVMFRIERGQILCHTYSNCAVLVRFDDEKPSKFTALPPEDNSSQTVFIANHAKFIEKLKKTKVLRISPTIYQEGSPIFEFDVSGFDQAKFKPKK